jgi:Putative abortive phage resistance protein AbiGi, antitoxin
MKTKLHEQLLFHWIGRDIEEQSKKRDYESRCQRAERYVSHLRGSLKHGLWVKTPDSPETLFQGIGTDWKPLPMTCFTEWRPDESQGHVKKYGRLGLGFTRNWVSKRGGQPVTYFKQSRDSRFLKAMKSICDLDKTGKFEKEQMEGLGYILHFAKPIRDKVEREKAVRKKRQPKSTRAPVVRDPFRRSFGAAMPFVAEREWRIVGPREKGLPANKVRPFVEAASGDVPSFYLPYKPGADLFTLVVPDNLTMNRVLQDRVLRRAFHPTVGPHVTIVSLEDVGSF